MISIVVPTYNEEPNIAPLVSRLDKALSGIKYEVIFVDDNSHDDTAGVIRRMAEGFPVSVIVRTAERGLATAVLTGIKEARGDIIVVMDADLQHPPEIVPKLVRAIEVYGADLAVGSRYVPGGGCPNWGILRKAISRGATCIAYMYLSQSRRLHDPMSGFYAFRKKCIEGCRFSPIGYKILLEMLVLGNFRKVAEVPYYFMDRESGRSKMKLKQQLDYLKHLASLRERSKHGNSRTEP